MAHFCVCKSHASNCGVNTCAVLNCYNNNNNNLIYVTVKSLVFTYVIGPNVIWKNRIWFIHTSMKKSDLTYMGAKRWTALPLFLSCISSSQETHDLQH